MNKYCIFLAKGICISYIALYTYIIYYDGESGNGNPHTMVTLRTFKPNITNILLKISNLTLIWAAI